MQRAQAHRLDVCPTCLADSIEPLVESLQSLVDRRQLELLPTISIYVERGNDPTTVRLLYMNEVALRIWKEMGM